ncbi:MAG TPA: hypothetical protein VFF03_18045 [Rhodocyclaceae bacterium]|nr:hypothetical protein [Rhodocyclaceae bacterium]
MTPAFRRRLGVLGAVLLAVCLPAWWIDRTTFLAAWLVAWSFWLGLALGGLASVWIHNLTGGAWGEAIRRPLLAFSGILPTLAVLFLPVAVGMASLYPWAADASLGSARWTGEQSSPGFKSGWLQPGPFMVRAAAILIFWNILAWAARQPRLERSGPFAAAALIAYGISASIAAVDWIMSVMPLWHSSIFGLEVVAGQALGGLALAVLALSPTVGPGVRRDLGNLLFTYVLIWAYCAFAQFLIIWSENLPHEIAWYVARREVPWLLLGLLVVLGQFAIPFFALLFRRLKESPQALAWVATGLLAGHLLDLGWLVLPSVAHRLDGAMLIWLLPATTLGIGALCVALAPSGALPWLTGRLLDA